MAEINMIPLVDIMLVLLIAFIITAPVMHHAFNLQLPQESSQVQQLEPESLQLAIQQDGSYRWGDDKISEEELVVRLNDAALKKPKPAIHLSADKETRYELIIHLMSLAQQADLTEISFVTEPKS
ncbi:MAG: ExbD/TolR family protein [Enterobacteriaceae bacterium]